MDSALSGKHVLMSHIMTFGPVLDLCCFYAETMLNLCRFGVVLDLCCFYAETMLNLCRFGFGSRFGTDPALIQQKGSGKHWVLGVGFRV